MYTREQSGKRGLVAFLFILGVLGAAKKTEAPHQRPTRLADSQTEKHDDLDFFVRKESESIYVYGEKGKKYSVKVPIAPKRLDKSPATGKLEEGRTYELYHELVWFEDWETRSPDIFLVAELTGLGRIRVRLIDDRKNEVGQHLITLDDLRLPTVVVFDSPSLSPQKDWRLQMENIGEKSKVDFWTCQLRKASAIDLDFNSSVRFVSKFAREIKIKVPVGSLQDSLAPDTRFQFTIQTNLAKTELAGDERLEMHINSKKQKFPTLVDFEEKASATYGTGLVKTIGSHSPSYCTRSDCVFRISVDTNDLDEFYFYPSVLNRLSLYPFTHFMELLEELQGTDALFYQLVPPKTAKGVLVSVTPIEHDPVCWLNVGFPPKHQNEFIFRFLGNKKTEFLLPPSLFEALGLSSNHIFIKCRGSTEGKAATFHLKARTLEPEEIPPLETSGAIGGQAVEGSLINLSLAFNNASPEIINLGLSLEVGEGSGMVIVKECSDPSSRCQVGQADLDLVRKNRTALAHQKSILRFTTSELTQDSIQVNNLNLNFRCGLLKKGEIIPDESILVSETCLFAVGLFFHAKGKRVRYLLESSAANNHLLLKAGKSKAVKANPSTATYYKLPIPKPWDAPVDVLVQVIVLTGKGTLFAAHNDPYPFGNTAQENLPIYHERTTQLETKTLNLTMRLTPDDLLADNHLYLTLQSDKFTILDLLPSVSPVLKPKKESLEEIDPDTNYPRVISGSHSFPTANNQTVFYKNFLLKIPEGPIDSVQINLNSNLFGLRICVYPTPDPVMGTTPCLLETTIEHLVLTPKDLPLRPGQTLLVSIQKIGSPDITIAFPLQFWLFVGINDKEDSYDLHLPGSTLRSFIEKGKNVKIRFDLSPMNSSGVLLLTTDDPELKIDIFQESDAASFLLTTLTEQHLGLHVPNATLFKKTYCRTDCIFYAYASTHSLRSSQFSFTFTFDDRPLVLKDGLTMRVPSFLPLYFLYETKDDKAVSFSSYSPKVKAVGYSRLVSKDLLTTDLDSAHEINQIKFDLKSDVETAIQLVYSKAELKRQAAELVLYLLQPKSGALAVDPSHALVPFTEADSSQIHIQTTILKLEPSLTKTDTIAAGQFRYYIIRTKEPIDFTITTLNVEGAVSLFLEKGSDEYPTTERFWKRSTSTKGDVLIIKAAEYQRPDVKDYTFVVGVLGVEASRFGVLFLPKFKNLIKAEFQKVIDLVLDPDNFYYLDFPATENSFESMISSEENDVEVSILAYSEDKPHDFLALVAQESNFGPTKIVRRDTPPLIGLSEVAWEPRSHLVVRLLTRTRPARATLLLFDSNQPIEAPSKKRFHYVLPKKTQSVFRVRLNAKHKVADVDLKVAYGKVAFSLSNSPTSFGSFSKLAGPTQKTLPFELQNQDNDIILFRDVYIKVISSTDTKFSVLVKPRDRFQELVAGEPSLVHCDSQYDGYLYFTFDKEAASRVVRAELEVAGESSNTQKLELLFADPTHKALDATSVFQPLAVLEAEEKVADDIRKSNYLLQVQEGHLVVKVPKNPNPFPFKVTLILDGVHIVPPNGYHHGRLPEKEQADRFSLYLWEAGEYRLVIESCLPVDVQNFVFTGDRDGTKAKLETHLSQTFPVILMDESGSSATRDLQQITYPIIRGSTSGSGMVTFRVSSGGDYSDPSLALGSKTYAMISEFKPPTQTLILKDYVEIFRDDPAFNSFAVTHDFIRADRKLRLTIRRPAFKIQLLDDFPDLRKVQLKLKVYLFSQPDFFIQIRSCGLSALDAYPKSVAEAVVTLDVAQLKDRTTDKFLDVAFEEADLEPFRNKAVLNVACYLAVRFLDSDEPHWHVSLDSKYTNVPYFFLTIRNNLNRLMSTDLLTMFLILFLLGLFGCFIASFNARKKRLLIETMIREVTAPESGRATAEEQVVGVGHTSMMSEGERLNPDAPEPPLPSDSVQI